MGGGNPIRKIEKTVSRAYDSAESVVSKTYDEVTNIPDAVTRLFGGGGSSSTAQPTATQAPKTVEKIVYVDNTPVFSEANKDEEMTLTGKNTGGALSSEGRVRVAQTKSGLSATSTAGLGVLMEELIKYLKVQYVVTVEDLVASEEERLTKAAKLDLIAEIEEIYERGYPNGTNATK